MKDKLNKIKIALLFLSQYNIEISLLNMQKGTKKNNCEITIYPSLCLKKV
jgi:hypothetical protein